MTEEPFTTTNAASETRRRGGEPAAERKHLGKTAIRKYLEPAGGDASSQPSTSTGAGRRLQPRLDPDDDDAHLLEDIHGHHGAGGGGHRVGRRQILQTLEHTDESGEFVGVRVRGRSSAKSRKKTERRVREITVPEAISVSNLANMIHKRLDEVVGTAKRLDLGDLSHDYVLTPEETTAIVLEFDIDPVVTEDQGPDAKPRELPDDMSHFPLRPPVVTIMGHVDHGKTTLLDALRESSVAASEAGGITQHIGAFSVALSTTSLAQPSVTFLDTPGHAAFSNMRSRGANMTDIVVLVVSADDGVMPQTLEAIEHAQKADVPMIVAINKCDRPGADPTRIREQLLTRGVQVEDMGGDVQAVEISALKKTGIEDLVENISILAEVLDIRAPPDGPVEAAVVESQPEKGRGISATMLVQMGTLHVGDFIVAGKTWCKVRSMINDLGKQVKSADPGTPVKITGWKDIPNAGDTAIQVKSESLAKDICLNRERKAKQAQSFRQVQAINAKRIQAHEAADTGKMSRKLFAREVYRFYKGLRPDYPQEHEFDTKADTVVQLSVAETLGIPTLSVVIKGDVSGTVEAVVECLQALPQRYVHVDVMSHGVGPIVESDVQMARSIENRDAVAILGFNVKPDKATTNLAKSLGIGIHTHQVIYRLLEDVKELMTNQLEPEYEEHARGEARILRKFGYDLKRGKVAHVAGCRVTSGTMYHDRKVRVMRGDKQVFYGTLSSLKSGKQTITEANKGQECGLGFNNFDDFMEGDVIYSLESIAKPRKLE
ncbi:translation initiation factor IF-2 [Tieghemiomyces parasiticus]|uniref:Translation initiation factor IF-2, mitochondrial n=1 Tax=Tieghemiomyces parasiticus TaxID=78921 RepID=A0A9W8ABL0_9FUNG|nr:translation initiation factor IF-2 [Tieghemiomyces parasiticus]